MNNVKNKIIRGWFIFCNIPNEDKNVIINQRQNNLSALFFSENKYNCGLVWFTVFNTIFFNISVIS